MRIATKSSGAYEVKSSNESLRVISLEPIVAEYVSITITGKAPLILQKFSEKSKQEMLEKQGESPTKAKKRVPRNPDKEYEAATYKFDGGKKYGIPCRMLKACALGAVSQIGNLTSTDARRAFQIQPQGYDDDNFSPLVEIFGDREMHRGVEWISSGFKKIANNRFRPIWKQWSTSFVVKYFPDLITLEKLLRLFQLGGEYNGIGEKRPSSKASEGFGVFDTALPPTAKGKTNGKAAV